MKFCPRQIFRSVPLLVVLVTVIAQPAMAQSYLVFSGIKADPDSSNPAGCLVLAEKRWGSFFDERSRTKAKLEKTDFDSAEVVVRAIARSCASRFKVSTAAAQDLPVIARILLLAADKAGAVGAVERASKVAAADSDRAKALSLGVSILLGSEGIVKPTSANRSPQDLAKANALAERLDSLGPVAATERLSVHSDLMRRADTTKKGEREMHLSRAFAAAKEMTDEAKKKAAPAISGFYSQVARSQLTAGDTVRAEATINDGLSLVSRYPRAASSLRQLQLLGKPAPILPATHWLNAPNGTQITPKGKVYLVMMTATW
jgi:hypothetical protein